MGPNPPTRDARALIDAFVTDRQSTGDYSLNTAKTLRSHLRKFAASLGDVDLFSVTKYDVRAWIDGEDVCASTKGAHISAAKAFYRWANEQDLIDHDPTLGVRRPRVPPGDRRALDDEQVEKLLNTVPDRRAYVIVSLMIGEGLRAAEVAAVDVADIDFERSVIAVRGKGFGGERSRFIPMTERTSKELALLLRGVTSGPVIRRAGTSDRLHPRKISAYVSRWMADAGIKKGPRDGMSAHALRHTAAESVADLTDNVRVVQQLLGHRNLATTQTYLRGNVNGLAEVQRLRSGED